MPRLLLPLLLLPPLLLVVAACADGSSDRAVPGLDPGAAPASTPPSSSAEPSPGTDPAPGTSPVPGTTPAPGAEGDQAYVGLTEQEALAKAKAEGTPVRVLSRDGESFPQTMDLREDRINLTVVGGRVTDVVRG